MQQLGGHIARFVGDGVMAYFGWPVSREDVSTHGPPPPAYRGGAGTPLVCLHGFTATWEAFKPVLPALTMASTLRSASSCQVRLMELSGFLRSASTGDSSMPTV